MNNVAHARLINNSYSGTTAADALISLMRPLGVQVQGMQVYAVQQQLHRATHLQALPSSSSRSQTPCSERTVPNQASVSRRPCCALHPPRPEPWRASEEGNGEGDAAEQDPLLLMALLQRQLLYQRDGSVHPAQPTQRCHRHDETPAGAACAERTGPRMAPGAAGLAAAGSVRSLHCGPKLDSAPFKPRTWFSDDGSA